MHLEYQVYPIRGTRNMHSWRRLFIWVIWAHPPELTRRNVMPRVNIIQANCAVHHRLWRAMVTAWLQRRILFKEP